MNDIDSYKKRVLSRSLIKYILGLIPRIYNYCKAELICSIARLRGATIGKNTYITLSLALKANKNLKIGYSTIIETSLIDLRDNVFIGNNVIINKGVQIIRATHNPHSVCFETLSFPLLIEDFCWITTNSLILPNCKKISYGCVTASSTTLISSIIENKTIVGGNPMKVIKKRENIHDNIVIESLQGRDLIKYVKIRINNER